MTIPDQPLQPGDLAPNFRLPAVNREGEVSLEDYRGKSAVMVGLFKGLHCPFCRRHIARMAKVGEKLAGEGIATLAIVATQLDRARQYFRYRPTSMELATDPEVQIHRAFGVVEGVILPDTTDPRDLQWPKTATMAQIMSLSINPNGYLPAKMHLMAASQLLNQQDGFEMTGVDMQMAAAHMAQFNSQFLIDASGTIRWSFVEARNSPEELCSSPGEEEMVAAARAVRQ